MLNVPIRLTWMTRAKSASGCGPFRPTIFAGGATPAQLTEILAGPCASRALAMAASAEASSPMSHATARPPICGGDILDRLFVHVEQRDPGARVHEGARRGLPQPRRRAGDDGRVTLDVHDPFPPPFSR